MKVHALAVTAIAILGLVIATTADAQRGSRGGGGGGGPQSAGRGGACSFDKCFDHCVSMGGMGHDTIIPAVGCSRRCSAMCRGNGSEPQSEGKW
jgi:hypothetical protein